MALLTDINALAQTPSSVLNFITGSDSSAGWAGTSATVTTNTASAFIPAFPIRTTSIKIDVTSGGGYGATSFTVPNGVGELVGCSFYYETNDTTASNWTVELWQGATQITLPAPSLVGNVLGLPFNFSVTLVKGATYNIRFKSAASGKQIYLSGVTVGTSIPVQGAAVSEWVNCSSILTVSGFGTSPTVAGQYQRIGSSMLLRARVAVTNTTGATTLQINLPTGFTVDTSRLPSATPTLGTCAWTNVSTGLVYVGSTYLATSTAIQLYGPNITGAWSNTLPAAIGTSTAVTVEVMVPIAEWASSGTVNLGAGAQQEYVSNSDVTVTGAATIATSVYGPNGSIMPTGAATTFFTKAVRFQYPIQADDVLFLEVQKSSGVWQPIETANFANGLLTFVNQNGTSFGVGLDVAFVNSTDVTVAFGRYAAATGGYGTAGTDWNNAGIQTYRWRVRKAKASSPVGFGLAGTDGSSGLYKAGQAPGLTTGAAISAGYVGEKLTVTLSDVAIALTATTYNAGSLTLTAGVWLVRGKVVVGVSGTTMTRVRSSISTTSATLDTVTFVDDLSTGITYARSIKTDRYVNTAGTTVYLTVSSDYTGTAPSTSSANMIFEAIRIA